MLRIGLGKRVMGVSMMLVVKMLMFVRKRGMKMRMFVTFSQMQPYAQRNQATGDGEQRCEGFSQRKSDQCAKKWRRREVRPGPRVAQVTQPHHEQGQTHAIR